MNYSNNKINVRTYSNNFNILIILDGDFILFINFFADGTGSVIAEFVVTIETIKTWFVTVIMRNIRIHNLCFFFLGKSLNQATYHIIARLCLYPLFCMSWKKTKYGLFCLSIPQHSFIFPHPLPSTHTNLLLLLQLYILLVCSTLSLDLTKTLHGFMHWTKDNNVCNPFWDSSELLKALVSTSNPFRFSFLIGCIMTCCSCFILDWWIAICPHV